LPRGSERLSDDGLSGFPASIGAPLAQALELIADAIDLIGIAILVFGFVVALTKLLAELSRSAGLRVDINDLHAARRTLATYILTALEFMIASDIIHSAITRDVNDLYFVALLVIIRTAISYFLMREIKELKSGAAP
jgi:uncharacterized membrane protein